MLVIAALSESAEIKPQRRWPSCATVHHLKFVLVGCVAMFIRFNMEYELTSAVKTALVCHSLEMQLDIYAE